MNRDLVERFCTPQIPSLTEYDSKVLAEADRIDFPFEGVNLNGYGWGKGRTVLLVHGWGSRASHLAHFGKLLSKSGFRVIGYDAPAHFSTSGYTGKSTSNMFEYCRAISAIAKMGEQPLYALIGHSFGAFCAALTTSAKFAFADYRIPVEKLLLISTPPTLTDVLRSFCRNNRLDSSGFSELKVSLEHSFSFSVEDYDLKNVLQAVTAKTLLIHDADDEEFPMADICSIQHALPHLQLFTSRGYGHQKILANRSMITHIKEFLLGTNSL